jgi:hypothetical protein
MDLQEFFKLTFRPCDIGIDSEFDYQHLRPKVVCKDGTTLSVQASRTHYCQPRMGGFGPYREVEVWPEVAPPQSWGKYYDGEYEKGVTGVFGYVPVELVQDFIDGHSGIDVKKTFGNWPR